MSITAENQMLITMQKLRLRFFEKTIIKEHIGLPIEQEKLLFHVCLFIFDIIYRRPLKLLFLPWLLLLLLLLRLKPLLALPARPAAEAE